MKFFEKIRANTAPPIEVEIENNILAQFFSPFFFKKNLEFNILYFISSGMRLKTKRNWGEHTKKWELLDQALEKNSPELGLMASWSIFEEEECVKKLQQKNLQHLAQRLVGMGLSGRVVLPR